MSRERSNCSTTDVLPNPLDEVISVTPAIRPNWRSRGVATADAMVSGLAPGSAALTTIVGYATCGSGATARFANASAPASASASASRLVATGRRMNGSESVMACGARGHDPRSARTPNKSPAWYRA
jgi:hypothetical protein